MKSGAFVINGVRYYWEESSKRGMVLYSEQGLLLRFPSLKKLIQYIDTLRASA